MLGSNWKALIASQAVTVGVKRKAGDSDGTAAAASRASAASTAEAVVTPCLALDCEFVGVGSDGTDNALARVSIVNFHGAVLYDKHVKPVDAVTDYRTSVSGVKPGHIHGKGAITFKQCQREVADLIKDRILVGHALHNDLQVMLLSHPKHLIRDTSKYKGLCPDRLKNLAAEVLQLNIQRGEHNSVEDARATLALYKHHRVAWEKDLHDKQRGVRRAPSAAANGSVAADGGSEGAGAAAAASSSVRPAVPRSVTGKKLTAAEVAIAARQEHRRALNVERNQRRKKMRSEQKADYVN